jgi:polysaccharide biosynthesis protein PslH
MNILYITSEVPYPLTSGYLRHFHFLQALSQHHSISLLSLTRRGRLHPDAYAALGPFLKRFEVFGARDRPRGGRLRRVLRMRLAARELKRAVAAHLAAGATDVVVLTGKDTFPAVRAVGAVPLVVDICDAASLRLRTELAFSAWWRRPERALRLAEISRVERSLVARTPFLLFASERDRAHLGAKHGVIVPNGVDAQYWKRGSPPATGPTVAFTGVMAYRPNHDAAMRLVGRVLPLVRDRVPEAQLVLAGRDPRGELREAASDRAGVMVTGACSDLRPHVEGAAVYCAPLRFASGMQNKLLEALAMEVPVVTTTVAAAGLRVPDEDPPIAVADEDEDLAAATARLMADPADRLRRGETGRRYVERHFSWPRSAALLESVLYDAVGRAR